MIIYLINSQGDAPAGLIMTIPVLILFAAAQRYFVSGVVMSGLKL